jgi:endonuclease/exonuclease/phosphatase (EEP) superfamily protein YafD
MIQTLFDLSGKEITIINCHALNFVTNKAWKTTIDSWISTIPESGAVIFAGDFNTWNTWRKKYLKESLLKKKCLPAETEKSNFSTLDHIFYRDIVIVKSDIDTNMHSSDHFPLRITFSLY